jgi:hypothetical protein
LRIEECGLRIGEKEEELTAETQRRMRLEEEAKEALEGDYMDYLITWIEADISFLNHVIRF